MTEGQWLFALDYERFNEIKQQDNLLKLCVAFEERNLPLSRSLFISQSTTDRWLLIDFENQNTYNIKIENDDRVEILEGIDIEKRTDVLSDAGSIVPLLQEGIGTPLGIIDALKRLNFSIDGLINLRRSDLATRKLSFQSMYSDLEVAYKLLYEILDAPREALIKLSSKDVQQVKKHILQSYEITNKIVDFGGGKSHKDIRERHDNLLREIHQFCDDMKHSLFQIASYLSSSKVDQLVDRVNTTFADSDKKLNTAIGTEKEKWQKFIEEFQQQTAEISEKLEETHLKYQNRLTEKPISQYKAIFDNQAKKHAKTAWIWLGITVGLTLVASGIFWWVFKDLIPTENNLPAILPNLLAKGFFLSLIYLLLNRSIKNYAAEKHLEVINIHRQNALETFDPFADAAAGNRETRDAVLLAATKAIFDANQSGYLSAKASGSDSATPVQQIIKEVLPSKSSDKSD